LKCLLKTFSDGADVTFAEECSTAGKCVDLHKDSWLKILQIIAII